MWHDQDTTKEFVETSLLIKQQEEPLNQNKYWKNPASKLVPSKGTEDTSNTIPAANIDKISQQNVQWIHHKLWLWCLPTQGKKKELIH